MLVKSYLFSAVFLLMNTISSFCQQVHPHEFWLVKQGKVQCVLVLAPTASIEEKEAAKEIQDYIKRISGVAPEIVVGREKTVKSQILIGMAASTELETKIRQQSKDPYSFALMVDEGSVSLRGLSPEGTRVAAYELLEQLGVRWFMPGEIGTVVPVNKDVVLKVQKTIQVPSFAARWTTSNRNNKKLGDEWMQRVRMGGPIFPSSHGIHLLELSTDATTASSKSTAKNSTESLFSRHPEYFALVGGKRKISQLCISNPEVLKMAIASTKAYFRNNPTEQWIGMGPNDGRGFCECDNCRALDANDYDPFAHEISVSDRYIWFFNKVLEGIKDEFPDKKIAFYAYSAYMRPPVRIKPDPKIVPATAVIGLCRLHGMGNPNCPEKSYEKQLTTEWGKIVPEVYNRGYWYNLSDPGLPFFMISRVKKEIPLGKALGIHGWKVETADNYAAELPSTYIAAKLMWNVNSNVDSLVDDFCDKFFGLASKPMKRYIQLLDGALTNADYHTGSSWDLPHIYTKETRRIALNAINEAVKLAGKENMYSKRVDMYKKDFNYFLDFADMIEQRFANNFIAAKKAEDDYMSIGVGLTKQEPQLLKTLHVVDYNKRFFLNATEEGYKRVSGGNKLVAGFKTKWDFAIDPERIGEMIGLWRPENKGGNWTKMESDYSWSDQGLRYYKGLAWYRQTVRIPAVSKGRRLFLWFGGVDEKASVWVNGIKIGESNVGSFQPFELEATNALKAGEENIVCIMVTNDKLNELGTGGIVGPVMIWSPADPNAQPQNGSGKVKEESLELIMQKRVTPVKQ
jgi:hypothetical protein